jgi:chromosome segregation ATPase
MWNPLRLPLVALGMAMDAARALAELPRAIAALEARVDRLAGQGEAILAELGRVREVVDGVAEQISLALTDVQAARAAMLDRTADTAAAEEQLEHAQAELSDTHRLLERTQADLAAANTRIERMLAETAAERAAAEPAEPVPEEPAQHSRRFGVFRRSPAAG